MLSAHIKLSTLNFDLCLAHLPKLFVSCVGCLLSDKQTVTSTATGVLEVIFKQSACILYVMIEFSNACYLHKFNSSLTFNSVDSPQRECPVSRTWSEGFRQSEREGVR